MIDKTDLAKRMKTYEAVSKTTLVRRMPVIVRIDGKSFHSFTRGFDKPFDGVLMDAMKGTMKYLCQNIQGCVLGYTQSDEITLVLIDYKKLNSSAWFDNEVQKICSISASMATMAFDKAFEAAVQNFGYDCCSGSLGDEVDAGREDDYDRYLNVYCKALQRGAMFDARCFNVPKEDVCNNIYWRQLDATRNSIQMVGQANFSHKQLQNKSCAQIQEMLFTEKGINWNDFSTDKKRGSCCVKTDEGWVIDNDIPIFKGDGRKYIEDLIFIEPE